MRDSNPSARITGSNRDSFNRESAVQEKSQEDPYLRESNDRRRRARDGRFIGFNVSNAAV